MPNLESIKITLTKAEAKWLYDVFIDKLDEGVSTRYDELMCSEITDKLDEALS